MNPQEAMFCHFYNGGHPNHECPSMDTSVAQVGFVEGNRHGNNLYSNTYNSRLRNNPNLSLGNQGNKHLQILRDFRI